MRFSILFAIAAAAAALGASPGEAAECPALKLLTSIDMKAVAASRPGIDVQVTGTTRTFLIDTGGVTGTLARRVAAELGLKPARSYRSVLTNVNGEPMNQTVRVPSLDIGAVHRDGTLMYVDDTTPPENAPGRFDGSLAPDVLRDFDVDLDFARGKFNLFSQDHCPGQVVYWQAQSVAVVPFRSDRSGHVIFDIELDGRRMSALLDTGTADTNLNLVAARRVFDVDPDAADVEKIGELKGNYTADIYRRNFKTLSVAGITIANPAIVLMPDMITPPSRSIMLRAPGMFAPPRIVTPRLSMRSRREPELPPVVLGMSVLRLLHVYIAYKEQKLYVSTAFPSGG